MYKIFHTALKNVTTAKIAALSSNSIEREPNLVPRVRFSFGQHQENGLWPNTLATSKAGSPQIVDFRLVYARSEI